MGMDDHMDGKYVDLVAIERELSDPNRMDKIANHLACGGTLIDYCKLTGQSFIDVKKWIKADPAREKSYEEAKLARQEWLFERVLSEYKAVSTFSMDMIFTDQGGLRPISEWPESARAAVASIESQEVFEEIDGEKVPVGEVKKVKLWDKTKTLQDIGKHLKMFAEVVDINVNTQISIVGAIEEAEKRLSLARPVDSIQLSDEVKESEEVEEPI